MGEIKFTIPLTKVIDEFKLNPVYTSTDCKEVVVSSCDVNRPGLQISGFYDYFDQQRIQVMGKVEMSYLNKFSPEERYKKLEPLFAMKTPCIIITRNLYVYPELIELAQKYDISLFSVEETTSRFMSALISYLNVNLAPRITRHGVLVEVYGEGVLLLGDSGVGKSETAVELVKRGHRLVADDAVEIKRVSSKTLVGAAPSIIKHFIELRGIGIIDVKNIFGMGAVKDTENIDLIIHLEAWQNGKQYDRLGLVDEYTNILGINIPSLTIPVKPGRNLAIITEIAAMNNRQKKMGYNAAAELNNRLTNEFGQVGGDN